MIEKWEKIVDDEGAFGTIDWAFDCIPHNLIIAKLEAYGFGIEALKLIHDYLKTKS